MMFGINTELVELISTNVNKTSRQKLYLRGRDLFDQKKYTDALLYLEKSANQYNNSDAQTLLGHMHRLGLGVESDAFAAIRWNDLADTGESCRNNGLIYLNGDGKIKQDYREASMWLSRASSKGDSTGKYLLGEMYFEGNGCNIDLDMAFDLYIQAASEGHTSAQHSLGSYYQFGYGVKSKNFAKAHYWYEKAVDGGSTDSKQALGLMYYEGFGIEQDLSKAVLYLSDAAEDGKVTAMYTMGDMYKNGTCLEKNFKRAMKWYKKAANENSTGGICGIGSMYREGLGVPQDGKIALSCYKKALSIDPKCPIAHHELSMLYSNGSLRISRDPVTSLAHDAIINEEVMLRAYDIMSNEQNYSTSFDESNCQRTTDWYKREIAFKKCHLLVSVERLHMLGTKVDIIAIIPWFQQAFTHKSEQAAACIAKMLEEEEDAIKHVNKINTYHADFLESQLIQERKEKEIAQREIERLTAQLAIAQKTNNTSRNSINLFFNRVPVWNKPNQLERNESRNLKTTYDKPHEH